jgi:opacity protein-like surface antigen
MKKLFLTTAMLSALVAPQAFAQGEMSAGSAPMHHAAHFEGFRAGLGLGFVGATLKMNQQQNGPVDFRSQMGQPNVVGNMDLSYTHVVYNDWLLGVGITYDLNNTNIGGNSLSNSNSAEFQGKQHMSLYLKPSYAYSDTVAFFAKLGYHSMNGNLHDTGYYALSSTNHTYSKKTSGLGYGLGMETLITSNIVVSAEMQMVNYSATKFDANATLPGNDLSLRMSSAAGIVSVAYKF